MSHRSILGRRVPGLNFPSPIYYNSCVPHAGHSLSSTACIHMARSSFMMTSKGPQHCIHRATHTHGSRGHRIRPLKNSRSWPAMGLDWSVNAMHQASLGIRKGPSHMNTVPLGGKGATRLRGKPRDVLLQKCTKFYHLPIPQSK